MSRLQRWGFDRERLRFAGYTAVGTCIAVFLAWSLGLEHPQWAGMSVWAASQPLRGQLFEKSLFRIGGTIIGIIVGVLLVLAMQLNPYLLVLGLAVWIALCTWGNNMQRGIAAYGTVLAGYSASMVALLDTKHPDQVFHLAIDRFATVLTGVVVAAVIGAIFARRSQPAALTQSVKTLCVDALQLIAKAPADPVAAEALLGRIAAFEETLEPHAAGGKAARMSVRANRRALIAATSLLLRLEAPSVAEQAKAGKAAAALAQDDCKAAQEALHGSACFDDLSACLARLDGQEAPQEDAAHPHALHKDRIGAREAALRAGGVMLVVGILWQLTGWPQGAYLLLGLSVMLSIFSSIELPVFLLRHVILGQILAGIAAVLCQVVFWPMVDSTMGQVLIMMPFILLGIPLAGHRRTFLAAMDYHLVFLLLLMPHLPVTASLASASIMAIAVVAAPILALLCYKVIYPVDLQRRLSHVETMVLHDLQQLARRDVAPMQESHWQMRLTHRGLRLIRLHGKLGLPHGEAFSRLQSVTRAADQLADDPHLSEQIAHARRLDEAVATDRL